MEAECQSNGLCPCLSFPICVNSSPSKPSLVILELGVGVYARGQESRGREELSTFCLPQYEIEIRNKR